ncbi:MAG: EAL domain-containing protein [Limnobacter sp.]|nr:EAL domain-containing protein [Limnobacter sp.]
MEYDLHEALKDKRFELHYQPRFNPANEVVALEALVRMRRTDGTLVPPNDFIPLAESTGLIIQLGDFVLKQACTWIVGVNQRLKQPLSIAVNVSGVQLFSGHLCDTVQNLLNTLNLPPHLPGTGD